MTVTVVDAYGNIVTNAQGSVTLKTFPGKKTASVQDGVAAFELPLRRLAGHRIVASSPWSKATDARFHIPGRSPHRRK